MAVQFKDHEERSLSQKIKSLFSFEPQTLYETETTAPPAFTYSLFYVYYD